MFKRWQKTLNSFNRLLDILLLFASYFIGTHLWLVVIRKTSDNLALTLSNTVWYALGLAIIIVCLYQLAGLYDYVRAKPFSYDISRVVLVNAIAAISTGALLFILRQIDFSRGVIIFYFLFSCIFVICKRALMRKVLNYYRSKGYNKKHVILIGTGELAKMYAETIRENPRFGYVIDGYIGAHDNLTGLTYFGEWERVGSDLLSKPGIDEVVAALDQDHLFVLPQIISATEKFGTKVSIIPYFHNYIPASTTFEIFGDCKLLNMRSTPLDYPGNAVLKRVLDFTLSLILIIITSPIMLFAAIGVMLSSHGPIIFRQTRVGKNKHQFQMYKFRSMRVNDSEKIGWSRNYDPRKTRFGCFIRKTSIDELPQLFNVLKGEMSLIGPRPEVPYFVEQFQETIPLYMLKHLVRPGITGWAQVNGYRGDTSIEERIKHDIWYIEHWSIWLDIIICLKTVFGGLINKEKIS